MKFIALVVWGIAIAVSPAGRMLRADVASAAQSAPTCRNVQLLIAAQSSQGAAGHIGIIYRIHNISGQACTLYGYPGVQLLNKNFISLPTTVIRGAGNLIGAIPKTLVRLGSHGNAYFALSYSDVPTGNGPCPTANYVMIFAPANFLPVVTYASGNKGTIVACNGKVNVSPVTSQPRYQ